METLVLLQRFMQLYPDFRERLRRRLGSADLADEALNEVYVKLSTTEKSYSVRNAPAYLFRLTLNAASDLRRSANRHSLADQIEAALDIPDPAPSVARTAEDREAVGQLEAAIATLTERRRMVLVAVRLHERSCREIAAELGVTTRTIEMELRVALDHCAEYMKKNEREDFAYGQQKPSRH